MRKKPRKPRKRIVVAVLEQGLRARRKPPMSARSGPVAMPPKAAAKDAHKPDDKRIDVGQDRELAYWSQKLRVSRGELRKAIRAAGPLLRDVQRHLGG